MFSKNHRGVVLLKRLSILLLIYSGLRLLFYIFNYSFFPFPFSASIFPAFLLGIRFDISAIIYSNLIFIVLHLIPLQVFYHKSYQNILKILFYVFNIPLIILNCVDFVYFRFILKRTTWDLFSNMGMSRDFVVLLPSMLRDFWYVIVIAAILIFMMIKLYKKIVLSESFIKNKKNSVLLNVVLAFIYSAILVIGSRGGLQYRPINLLSAAQYTKPANAPLILNTSFSIIKSLGRNELEEVKYFSDKKSKTIYSINHPAKSDSVFKNLNVVIIIMESFSKEFVSTDSPNKKSFTPFLDSLAKHSLICSNAFANGKKSIDGIPSILAGLPSMLDESYITSAYSGNKISSLASLLHQKGYETSFFHGGINGTMGFDGFTKMAGFDKYFGKSEYPNPSDYDGDWGIYDEPFFQFFNKKLSEMKQPFLSSIFSISSHHPYNVPEKYKDRFPEEKLPIYRSIRYADLSLQNFFKAAEKEKWYNHTLFVITADHTSPGEKDFYKNQLGAYSIPLMYFKPGSNLVGINKLVTQQIDILPSVLDYLNYDKNYSAFGTSIFSKESAHFAINYTNGIYQFISEGFSLQFDGTNYVSMYDLKEDSLLEKNLINLYIPKKKYIQDLGKAMIQSYNHALIYNKMNQN